MLCRKRLKTLLVVLAVTTCIYVFAFVNLRPSRHERQTPGRRLHIVRITNEDISKLGGGVEPPDLPPSLLYPRASPLVTVIPPPSPLLAVPSQFFPEQPAARGEDNFLYDASDVLYKPRSSSNTSGPSSARQVSENRLLSSADEGYQNPVDLGDQKPVDLGDQKPVDFVHPNLIDLGDHKPSHGETRSPVKVEIDGTSDGETQRDNSAYTIEKEVIAQAQLGPIPRNRQKKLEMFLAHLSSDQFEEVYRNIIGYQDELSNKKVETRDNELNNSSKVQAALSGNTVDDHKSGVKGSGDSHLMLPGKIFGLTEGARSQAQRRCGNACVGRKHSPLSVRGYGARVEIESLTLPPDWTSTPEVEERLKWRRQHVKDVCHKYNLDTPSANNSINAWEFFISAKHKLVWCSVFKAASSTWIYNFNVLAGYSENYLLKAKDTPVTLARKKYPRPSAAELVKFMNGTEKPLSFVIARHPLHRLVSAYRDKLLSGQRYYSKLARKIVLTYPHLRRGNPEAAGGGLEGNHKPGVSLNNRAKLSRKMVVPSFPQLVQYLIDSHKRGEHFDEHWTPINKFCTPCLFPFDVIAKLETIDEDSNYVIFKSGIEKYIKPKRINRNKNAPTDEVADSFLCQLSRDMMRNLIDIYKMDLELFDYEYQHYLDCTTDHVRLERVDVAR